MTTDLLKPELSFLNNMDLAHKNVWAPFSNYTLQLHMDFHGFKWLISFCACSFQISIIMFIFLYRLTGGDDHADQRGKACLKCFCDTFDSDRCMNSLTRRWMSICSRSMGILTFFSGSSQSSSSCLRRVPSVAFIRSRWQLDVDSVGLGIVALLSSLLCRWSEQLLGLSTRNIQLQ